VRQLWPWFRDITKGAWFPLKNCRPSDGPDRSETCPHTDRASEMDIPSHNFSNQFAKIDLRF